MILGIDLGQKTTGLAISSGTIATPLNTITHKSINEAVDKISEVCSKEKVDTVVLGFVQGKIKSYFDSFKNEFKKQNPSIKIILRDETLTSRQATETMVNLGIPKLKRRVREHEIAAAHILESYLSEQND